MTCGVDGHACVCLSLFGEERERRCHFKEKMSLEEAHHHRRQWIRAWRKKEMNEGRGREEHKILCSKRALKSEI